MHFGTKKDRQQHENIYGTEVINLGFRVLSPDFAHLNVVRVL
jgi:hypothetical protein